MKIATFIPITSLIAETLVVVVTAKNISQIVLRLSLFYYLVGYKSRSVPITKTQKPLQLTDPNTVRSTR